MSVANLLNTNTVNFQDLVGNGKTYLVPLYQRDYSWTEEQWEDLWADLAELRPNAKKQHYMGAVVVKPETDRKFLIIDGQQRIATLTILALAVIARLNVLSRLDQEAGENLERAKALRARYVGEKDPASLVEISKLVMNTHDDGFFQDYLVQLRRPANPRGMSRSNRLLWECFLYFERRIGEDPTLAQNGLRLAELLSEVMARQLMFILITVDDEVSAYTVFETLNARGLELTTTDLLKNYLFSRLRAASDLDSVQRRWQRLTTLVRQERFAEFLRYHYLTKYRQIRSGRLFKLVRDEVTSSSEVLALMNELEGRAELFDALSDPNHSLWAGLPEAKPWVRELRLFRVRQMTPLLFASKERFSDDDFVRILKLVSVVSFRYTIVSGLNPNELEPVYHDAARAVLDGTANTPRKVFDSLRSIYVSDAKFRSDFTQLVMATGGQRRKVTKYILAKLESDLANKECDPETDLASIEHILPENPGTGWEETIPRTYWEESIYRLGNLSLLEPNINRQVGNEFYPIKVRAYQHSVYVMTQHIADIAPESWTLELMNKRQVDMAQRAEHVWRSDFDDGDR